MASSSFPKIISGGQTGADQAALYAARTCGLSTGGWAPKDYLTLDGLAPWLAGYGLQEMPSRNYVARSIKNVDEADATLAFRNHPSSGTDKTIGYALSGKWRTVDTETYRDGVLHRPLFIVTDILSHQQQLDLVQFIRSHNVKILNVCGHREPDKIGKKWTRDVESFLVAVFLHLQQ